MELCEESMIVLESFNFPAMPKPPALPDWRADDIRKAVVEAMKQPVGMFTLFRKGVF